MNFDPELFGPLPITDESLFRALRYPGGKPSYDEMKLIVADQDLELMVSFYWLYRKANLEKYFGEELTLPPYANSTFVITFFESYQWHYDDFLEEASSDDLHKELFNGFYIFD